MIYLKSFNLPSASDEEDFYFKSKKARKTCYDTHYPFGLFKYRELETFSCSDITIIYGDNGSGKSTILNVLAEKLGLERNTPYNRTDFFDDYVQLTQFATQTSIPVGSRIITSDGVFERVLDIRRINDGIDADRENLVREYIAEMNDTSPNTLHGLEDYERWKKVRDIRDPKKSQSQFLRQRLVRNIAEKSNGESALAYFVDSIVDNKLYLLDEPENSLSAQNQILLKYFIEDSVRYHGCQFVISTHSPFLLSIRDARIYDIDSTPPAIRRWSELEAVRAYYDFFSEHKYEFED